MAYLIDTCIWIDVERGATAPADVAAITGEDAIYLSPITIAELQFGAERAADDRLRLKRLSAIARLKRKPLLVIDETTGEIFGRVAAAVAGRASGPGPRVQDIWLASQAIQHNLRILTKDRKDFSDIPGLELVIWGEST